MELDSEGMDSPVKVIACNNETAEDYEVEKITGMRLVKNKLWFRVRWKGYGKDMATWEPRANLTHCEELLNDYVSKMEDKKYKQKKRRQMRNALIHTVKKKETRDDIMKTKIQAFQGNIRRKRFIKKFISKPNRYFTRVPQTKWQMNGDQLEMVELKTPEKSPLETQTMLPLETPDESPFEMPKELRLEKLEDSPFEKPEALPLESPKQKTPIKRGRGRPKKNSTKMPDLLPQTQLCPESREPLEVVDDIITLEDNSISETKVETVVKRGRGRPRKSKIIQDGERLQSDFCVPERTKDIAKKRRKPKKGMADRGVPMETTDHLWKGDIKLKKVVIRELRSLKALLEFQRQLSDEEKENLTDRSKEKPSSMEDRHVHASECHNRFYIRIKTGSFKDLSTKRRRKRKAAKEKRKKKREAAKEEQSRSDGTNNELLDNKQRGCDEVEEGADNGCDLQDVMEISSSSEGELGDGDSVESQTDAPSLNEEYDEFGYDDFFDFSKDNDPVGDDSKLIDAELPLVLDEKEMDGPKMPGDGNEAVDSNNHEDESNSKSEKFTGGDAVINDEEQEEMEEDEALADESSSLVIPFDEEEESSSLIIGDDGMEDDDDDDDDEDDLREFGDNNSEIQEPIPSAATVLTADSLGDREKEVTHQITKYDKECQKTEHFKASTDVVDSIQAIVALKCRSEEDIERQQKEKQENVFNGKSSDCMREENMSKMLESKSTHDDNLEDIATLSEDNSRKVEKLDSQIDSDEEFEMDEEGEEEEGINSASPVPMETDRAVKQSTTKKDWTKLNEEQPVTASQTPVVGDCGIEKMNSQAFSERKDTGEIGVAELEPQVSVLSVEERMMKESMKSSTEEINAVFTQNNMENVEKNHASEVIDSQRHLEYSDDVESKEDQTDKECKVNTEVDRETNDTLTELAVEESIIEKDETRLKEERLIKADQMAELERSCALAMTELDTFSQNKNEGNSIGHDRIGRVACVEMMQGECNIEEFRPTTDDSIDPQVTELSKCKELDGESELDATTSQFSVAKEREQKEVILDDKMEDMESNVLDRAAENLTQELTTPEETDKNDDQGAVAGQENEEEIESAISGAQENIVDESKTSGDFELVRNDMPQKIIEISKPDLSIKERDNKETDDTEGYTNDQVEDIGESYCMERKEESSKEEMMIVSSTEIVKENVKSADQGEQEQRPTKTGDAEMESETANALEIIKKELALNEAVLSEKDSVLQSDTCSNKLKPISSVKTDNTQNVEVGVKGDQQQKPTKTGDEKIHTETTNALELIENELALDKEVPSDNDCMLQRDSNELHPNSTITTKDMQNVAVDVQGELERNVKAGDGVIESETASALEIIRKELALEEEVLSAKNCMLQRESSEIKPKSNVIDDTQNVEVDVQGDQQQKPTKMDDEEIDLETASALEIIEKELVFDEEMESERKDVSQRDSDNIKPDLIIINENLKAEDQKEQDKKGTKTDDEEMDMETQHVYEITDQESTMVKEVEGENKRPEEECTSFKLKVTRELEKNDYFDHGMKIREDQIVEQINDGTISALGLPDVSSKGGEDETNSPKEMEVEEKADDQIDSATVTPRKDGTVLREGADKVERITKIEEEKICTSPQENVKDQNICNDEAPQVDLTCNNDLVEAAVTVSKEQMLECRETQDKNTKGKLDLLMKEEDVISLAISERETKTAKENEEGGNETKDGDMIDNDEEPAKLEIPTTKDNLQLVEAETEEEMNITKEKTVEEHVENNSNGDHNKQDSEIMNHAKTELENDPLIEKKKEEQVSEMCHDNSNNMNDAFQAKKDEINKEVEFITDELKNNYNKNKQVMFFQKAESPKNKTTSNKDDVQEVLPKKTIEIEEKKNNRNACKLQEPALLEKVRAESDDRKARERGREDKVRQLEEGELEEGEIQEVQDDEEEEKVDGIVENKDDDREEGEIREEMEDIVEEIGRSDQDEEVTPVSKDGLGSIDEDSVKDCSHLKKGESLTRHSQETFEILESSKSNSDHRTTRQDEGGSDENEEVTPVGIISKSFVKDNSHSQKGESSRRRSQEALEIMETSKSNTNHRTTRQYRRRSDQGEEVTRVGNISKNSVKDNSHSHKGESLRRRSQESLESVETSKSISNHMTTRQGSSRRRSQEAFEIVETSKSNSDHRTTQQDGRRSDRVEEVTPVGIISKNSVKISSYSQKLETLRRRSQEAFEIVETSKGNSDHTCRTTQQDGEKRRTTRIRAINMKRNFNVANPTKDPKRSKTLAPSEPIAIDDDNDDVEVVENDIHPKLTIKNSTERDVFIIEEDCAKSAGTEIADQTRPFQSEHHSSELSPKFGFGIKKLLPTSSLCVSKVDKTGSKARKLVQSMKAHIQKTVGNTGESGGNELPVIKNSACKAQGFKTKDAVCEDREQDLIKRLEGTGGGDADTRASKSGTKRKSDDDTDGDEGSKTRPKKKSVGASRKEVWQMVTKKEKKPAEPIWEGSPKINRQKIVIKISKKLLTDQPETKEPDVKAKRKEPERSSSRNGWKEAKRVEGTGSTSPAEQKEKRENQAFTSRGEAAASTSTGAVGRWSALPKAKPDKTRNDSSGGNSKPPSDKFLKDLKELKTHGIKQADLSWVRDLLETDHTECLSEACAALTKFMDSNDHKINLVVEMGFCPLLVKLLRSRSPAVISSALLAVSHIVSGNDYQTQAVLECSPLPLFCSFLSRNKYDVTLKKEACLALSNITAGTSQQIQHLVNDGLFPVLLSTMQHDEFQVMYEATWAVANATVNGSPEQIRYIVKQGFFQAFSEVLKHSDDTLVQIALDAMFNVLKLDTKPKKYGKLSPYCSQVKEYGGLQRIRSVRMTGSTVVKKKAYNMLNSFFPDF